MSGPDWLKDGELSGSPDPQMPEECLAEMKCQVTYGLCQNHQVWSIS